MSSRILTTSIAGIDAFMRDPRGVLTHAEGGTVAVFADNAPAVLRNHAGTSGTASGD